MKILRTHTPGLGDHLRYSTLPEEFFKKNEKFYLHNNCLFTNTEIYDLVWGSNPYVMGIINGPPNAGDEQYCYNSVAPTSRHYIKYIEAKNGILSNNKYPKIYYTYNRYKHRNFKNKVFLDCNLNSYKHYCLTLGVDFLQKFETDFNLVLNKLLKEYNKDDIYLINFKNHSFDKFNFTDKNIQTYRVEDIFEYCEIIKNCRAFICCFSGSAVLASAIKQNEQYPDVKVIMNHTHYLNNLTHKDHYHFLFDNVEYLVF